MTGCLHAMTDEQGGGDRMQAGDDRQRADDARMHARGDRLQVADAAYGLSPLPEPGRFGEGVRRLAGLLQTLTLLPL